MFRGFSHIRKPQTNAITRVSSPPRQFRARRKNGASEHAPCALSITHISQWARDTARFLSANYVGSFSGAPPRIPLAHLLSSFRRIMSPRIGRKNKIKKSISNSHADAMHERERRVVFLLYGLSMSNVGSDIYRYRVFTCTGMRSMFLFATFIIFSFFIFLKLWGLRLILADVIYVSNMSNFTD